MTDDGYYIQKGDSIFHWNDETGVVTPVEPSMPYKCQIPERPCKQIRKLIAKYEKRHGR